VLETYVDLLLHQSVGTSTISCEQKQESIVLHLSNPNGVEADPDEQFEFVMLAWVPMLAGDVPILRAASL
jgi:hypothetical protein